MSDRKSLRVRIEGRVQGVWYRGWMIEEASGRGLDGWVRNRRDGSVEAVLSGPEGAVEAMLEACWRGPSAAQVAAVRVGPEEAPVAPGVRQRQSSGK